MSQNAFEILSVIAGLAGTGIAGWAWGEHVGRQRAGRIAAAQRESRRDEEDAQRTERQRQYANAMRLEGVYGARSPHSRAAADLQHTLMLPATREGHRPATREALAVCAPASWWCPECGRAGTFVPKAGAPPATVGLMARQQHRWVSHRCSGADVSIHSGTVGSATD